MLEDSALDELMRDADPVDRLWTTTEVDAALARTLHRLTEVDETPARLIPLTVHRSVSRWAFAGLSAGASVLAAVVVVGVLLLSSSTTAAFAGWTASPSRPTVSQLAAARAVCGEVRATALVAAEARGPYVAIAYTRDGRPWQCITHGSTRLWDTSTQYPPGEVIKPGAASIYLPSIHHAVVGAGVAAMKALNRDRAKLFREKAPISRIASVQKAIFALDTGRDSLTAVAGSAGRAVTGVTFLLRDGTRVKATVGRGWYLAWWPGAGSTSATEPIKILLTTAAGTKLAPDSAAYLRGYYEPCLVQTSYCVRSPAINPIVPGIAPSIIRDYSLFRTQSPVAVNQLPRKLRVWLPRQGVTQGTGARLGLDFSAARAVSFGRLGWILAVPGNQGLCTFYSSRNGGGSGVCNPLASRYIHGGTGQQNGRYLVLGIVPNGYNTVHVRFAEGATVIVPVKDNLYLATLANQPTGVTSKNAAGHVLR
jgi:hypothetical protein